MEGEIKNQKLKNGRKPRKRVKLDSGDSKFQEKKQNIHDHQQGQVSDDSDSSSGWSSEVIEPAIKSMAFRNKRGTRMKELIKGKHKKDQFWDKYQDYFGGDINKPDNEEDEEDYQASSSGRDQFDSDFDLTDSYVGKRGRKKGTKIKRRKRAQPKTQEVKPDGPVPPKGRRGRKRKVPLEPQAQQKSEILLKEGKNQISQKYQLNEEEIKLNSAIKEPLLNEKKCQFELQRQLGPLENGINNSELNHHLEMMLVCLQNNSNNCPPAELSNDLTLQLKKQT